MSQNILDSEIPEKPSLFAIITSETAFKYLCFAVLAFLATAAVLNQFGLNFRSLDLWGFELFVFLVVCFYCSVDAENMFLTMLFGIAFTFVSAMLYKANDGNLLEDIQYLLNLF